MDYFGVALIGALRQDHLHKLGDDIYVRVLQIALLQCAHSAGSSWRIRDWVPGRLRLLQKVGADGVQASGIGEGCELDRAKLCGIRLPGKSRRYDSILRYRDVGGIRGNGDRGQHCIAVRGHESSLIVRMEVSCSGVSDGSVRPGYLEEPGALNRKIEWTIRLVEVALRHDHFAGCGFSSEADLETR